MEGILELWAQLFLSMLAVATKQKWSQRNKPLIVESLLWMIYNNMTDADVPSTMMSLSY
jgi:hypothetical protein